MRQRLIRLLEASLFFRSILLFYRRLRIVRSYLSRPSLLATKWLFRKTEDSNFYYSLEPENRSQLLHFVANALDCELVEVERVFSEIENSLWLREELLKFFKQRGLKDSIPNVGRRVAWYAITRISRPKLIVETGVHHGVGSLVFSMALHANILDGFPGKYIGVDIDPSAGTLLDVEKFPMSRIVISDSLDFLRGMSEEIDLFIHDSDHSEEYESREFKAVSNLLSPSSFLLSDNSHASSALRTFSESNNRKFLYFSEKPADHWYPGAGIGISRE